MSFDAHANFSYSTVATAPSPATSGTSLAVQPGDGAKFPTPPFNVVVWQAGINPNTTNAEVCRVTAIATDTLTITRTQEGSAARAIVVGDQIGANITNKTLTDIESVLSPFANSTKDLTSPTTLIDNATSLAFGQTSFDAQLTFNANSTLYFFSV
jgi:hypothetical protein